MPFPSRHIRAVPEAEAEQRLGHGFPGRDERGMTTQDVA